MWPTKYGIRCFDVMITFLTVNNQRFVKVEIKNEVYFLFMSKLIRVYS